MSRGRRRFRFIKEIAEGGFGKVYLAEQLSADGFSRIVAIKLLHAKWSSHAEVVMRTRDEARLLGLIRHQNIVRVEDLTSIEAKCAIVMEYLEGVDLKGMMGYLQSKGKPFPRKALFEIMISVASALDRAFNGVPLQGGEPLRVIHRDIKPSNIFVTIAGGVKVLDFGTARANFAEREAKTQALAFGSQGYMAPERMLGEEDTPAADVFSLAITLYELLTLESFGRIPPRPNKFVSKAKERVKSIPLQGDPEWCDQVRETITMMMAYEPGDRPTAAQLIDMFELLAQNADDMGMRRFCRTLVAEAKANEPELETGDPLISRIVDEDESGMFGPGGESRSVAPHSQPAHVPQTAPAGLDRRPAPTPPPTGPIGLVPPPPPPPQSPRRRRTQEPSPLRETQPQRQPDLRSVPPSSFSDSEDWPQDLEREESEGSLLKFVLLGIVIVVFAAVAILVLAILGSAIYVYNQPATDALDTDSDTQVVETEVPEVVEPVCEISSIGRDGGAKSKQLTLLFSEGNSGHVTVLGGFGFKAEWDGKGPSCTLEGIPQGGYRTNVKLNSGETERNKKFEVEADKYCTFTFSGTDRAWQGACTDTPPPEEAPKEDEGSEGAGAEGEGSE